METVGSTLQIVRYPPRSEDETAEKLGMFGVGEHSDSGFLSLLLQDVVGGLQARTLETFLAMSCLVVLPVGCYVPIIG
jgi:isopenicillin N synthase-like dioxygenase